MITVHHTWCFISVPSNWIIIPWYFITILKRFTLISAFIDLNNCLWRFSLAFGKSLDLAVVWRWVQRWIWTDCADPLLSCYIRWSLSSFKVMQHHFHMAPSLSETSSCWEVGRTHSASALENCLVYSLLELKVKWIVYACLPMDSFYF